MRLRLRHPLIFCFAVLCSALLTLPAAAEDPRQQRDQVRERKAAVAVEVDALRTDAARVGQALTDLQENVSAQQGEVNSAQQARAASELEAGRARAAEAATGARIDELRGRVRDLAVESYVKGHDESDLLVGIEETTGRDLGRAYLVSRAGSEEGLLDQLRALQEDQATERARAERAEAQARAFEATARRKLGDLETAKAQQSRFIDQVNGRLDQRLAEAAGLDQVDSQLSDQIRQQEAALARRVPASASGSFSAASAAGPLTTVRGITVASSVAPQLGALLDAADADGVPLSGSGYRDPNQQMSLRRQNCPDAVNSSPGACRPPTARAGASMHERGLAVDFRDSGGTLNRGSVGYGWMASNAARFGFVNLPSEPWHWSVNGQ